MKDISKLTDEKLAELISENDKELFVHIIRRYEEKLLRYATYILNDSDAAADIVQESFIKAYINLNGFDTRKKFSSWIYRIVHNQAMNWIGKNKKNIPLLNYKDIDSGISVEDEFARQEINTHTQKCLEKMPVIYKEPISLYFMDNKSYEEIGEILRIPTGTVGTRINRGKIILKQICKK